MRSVYSDQIVSEWAADLTADGTDEGEVNGASFNVAECYSPVVIVNLTGLGSDKSVAFKLQHKDTADTTWEDVPKGTQTDASEDDEISENGVYQYGYAGQKDQFRVVLVSKSASPGASANVVYQRHRLWEKPNNKSF